MRELTKPVTRRIGNFVVTLCEYGVSIRRYRHAKDGAAKITFRQLIDLAGADPLPKRAVAFDYAVQPGWMPKAGDDVFLNPSKTGLARGTVISVIPAVPEPCFLVRMARGRTKIFERCDLRPAPKRKHREKLNGRMSPMGD